MIPFSPPHVDDEIINEIVDTIKSGWWTTGPKTKLFEKKIAEYCNCQSVLAVNSATAGLELILRWFGVERDDEVIVPSYTYCATANVVMHCGATPVMVDINNEDFNISIENLRKAITPRTKVIMPVDIGGLPADYSAINKIVNEPEIKSIFEPKTEIQAQLGRVLVLSDAAHSFGAEYSNKKTGSLTDVTVFSFHAVKNLTTAEGGAIVLNLPEPFNNNELYKFLNILTLHGQNKDALAKTQKGSWRYDVIAAGYKSNMTDILASIGLVELERYDSLNLAKRKYIFDRYTSAFSKYIWAELPIYMTEEKKSSCHVYLLRIKNISEEKRDRIIQEIFEQGVAVNVHFQPLPLLSFYKNLGYDIKKYPVSYDNFSREISLPVYVDLTDYQVDTVIEVLVSSVLKIM